MSRTFFDNFNPKVVMSEILSNLPVEKQIELEAYPTLTRQEQLAFRKNFILEYGFGVKSKEFYSTVTGGAAAILAYTTNLRRGERSKTYTDFQKGLAGAFLGGHIGQLAISIFNGLAKDGAVRSENQENFIVSTMALAGSQGIGLLEAATAPEDANINIDIMPAIYAGYNAYNFISIGFHLYWQNVITAEFDKLFPLNPEVMSVPTMLIENEAKTPIAGIPFGYYNTYRTI